MSLISPCYKSKFSTDVRYYYVSYTYGVYYSCFGINTQENYSLRLDFRFRKATPLQCVPDRGVPERYSLEDASIADVPNLDRKHAVGLSQQLLAKIWISQASLT
jgi:hypothetical protein